MQNANYSNDLKNIGPKARRSVLEARSAVWAACAAEGFELSTRKEYSAWARRFAVWLVLRPRPGAAQSPAEKISDFLRWLAAGQGALNRPLSAVSLDQARHALLFLYQIVRRERVGDIGLIPVAKRPKTLPHVLTPEQTRVMLAEIKDGPQAPFQLMARLLYCTGARITDVLSLRVQDIDWRNSEVVFRHGKGGKDRRVLLPCAIMPAIKQQLRFARVLFDADQRAGVPVSLPRSVYHKCPRYGFAPVWFWVFPAPGHSVHPDHGHKVRWHIHQKSLQRAVRVAATRLGLDGLCTPHRFRHACATDLLDRGANIRHVQEQLGHESVETTMGYTHVGLRDPRLRTAIESLGASVAPGVSGRIEHFVAPLQLASTA